MMTICQKMGWTLSQWWALPDAEKDRWVLWFRRRSEMARKLRESLHEHKALYPDALVLLALEEMV